MVDTLGDALPHEIERITIKRDRWIKMATEQPEMADGLNFTIALMQHEINIAVSASAQGDVGAMIASLESLRAYSDDD